LTSTDLVHVPQQPVAGEMAERTLAADVAAFMLNKKKKLTAKSERGYWYILRDLVDFFPDHTLAMFEPPFGSLMLEDFLNVRWGHLSPSSYNKGYSVLSSFFAWQVARMNLLRDPMAVIEKATPRAVHRTRFSEEEWLRIFAANPDPCDQIALHLLLDYAVRKGTLQKVRFEHFDWQARELTIFTKGEKIFRIDIPDGRIWRLLDELDAPGHHYLLCRQVTRRRKPLRKKLLIVAAWLITQTAQVLAGIDDPACARELEMAQPALAHLERWITLASEAARRNTSFFPEESIGEHGCHIWWYKRLERAGVVDKGVTKGRKMHSARYTAAQRLLEATGDITEVQTLLCHTSSATTDLYVKGDSRKVGASMAGYVGRGEDNLAGDLQQRARSRR
jgi:site-specific recombinase XerC